MRDQPIRYRRRRCSAINPREAVAERGDFIVRDGQLLRLRTPRSPARAAAGLLYCAKIKPPADGLVAQVQDGEIYWVYPEEAR